MEKNELTALMPSKYIIAVIGDANAGKTTTINKIYHMLVSRGAIKDVVNIWGTPDINYPTVDFSLTGTTRYGLTGIMSQGDQICYLEENLEDLAKDRGVDMILCACRKGSPDTYKAVAKISWMYGYNIIWAHLSPAPGISKDSRTDALAAEIAAVF